MNTTYCALFRIGYWCSLDAACETSEHAELPLINHRVRFRLIDRFGEHLDIGSSIMTGQPHTAEVFDEDGETFPDLDAAIRAHAEKLAKHI